MTEGATGTGGGAVNAVTVTAALPAPPEQAWQALLDAAQRRRWWPQMRRLDPAAGGVFEERWSDGAREVVTAGRVEAVEPASRLRLRWADDDWPTHTHVTIELSPGPGGTAVRVRHEGWRALPDGDGLARAHERGWRTHVERWRRHLEG